MLIKATITNDQITPNTMAHISMQYFNKGQEIPEYRSTHITLHEMAQQHIDKHEQQYVTVETVDKR